MYSDLVTNLAQSLNKKDLILSGTAYKQDSGSELAIFGMCKLSNLEHYLQALTVMREMWTRETTTPIPNSTIDVRIRNMNKEVELNQLQHHPILCTVDLDDMYESLEVVPQLG